MAKNLGILGRKVGMTRIFADDGSIVPVTVVEAKPCPVLQVKGKDKEGYTAVQVGAQAIPERKLCQAARGHQAKADKGCFRVLREFRFDDAASYELGQELTVELFKVGEKVKVTGTSKGKGTQGPMKRHNMKGSKDSHGCEKVHRSGGSIGNNTLPGRVRPGKRMAGRMGDETVTYKNMVIVGVRPEENLILLKGQVPGAKNGLIMVRKQG